MFPDWRKHLAHNVGQVWVTRRVSTAPGLTAALEALVNPVTRGDPMSALGWTYKNRAKLTAALTEQGWRVSSTTVGRLLLGGSHPDRNAQLKHLNARTQTFLEAQQPVISVDTKKKEFVGDFKNAGREWQPTGTPEPMRLHDFPGDAVATPSRTACMTWRATKCRSVSAATLTRSAFGRVDPAVVNDDGPPRCSLRGMPAAATDIDRGR